MNKELEEAIQYLMLMRKRLNFDKYGYVHGADSIDTVLDYIENSVNKDKKEKHYMKNYKKKINLKKIQPLTEMNLINAREDVNAEKIQEIITELNKLINIYKEEENE